MEVWPELGLHLDLRLLGQVVRVGLPCSVRPRQKGIRIIPMLEALAENVGDGSEKNGRELDVLFL